MIIVCAWCNKVMGEKHDQSKEVTHSICPACEEKAKKEISRIKLKKAIRRYKDERESINQG